jgi:hypothetical protein
MRRKKGKRGEADRALFARAGFRKRLADARVPAKDNVMSKKKRYQLQWTHPIGANPGVPMIVTDAAPGVGWGVLRRKLGNVHNDLTRFVAGKLHPFNASLPHVDFANSQQKVSFSVELPSHAPADLLEPHRLAERYEQDAFPWLKDLACCAKLKIARNENLVSEWDRIRRFAQREFCELRSMAVICVLHVPSRAGVNRDSHVHLIAPARELKSDGFGAFVRPLATDAGGPEIAKAWAAF